MKILIWTLSFFIAISQVSFANEPIPSADIVVHLLDYLAKDYAGAVKDGKVISQSEYNEQIEFAETVYKSAGNIPMLKSNSEFYQQTKQLLTIIQKKQAATEVSMLARKLQQAAIQIAAIEVAPKVWPDINKGQALFQVQCTTCHGNTGRGDGLAGVNLDPKPANFHDADLIQSSTPYKFYNTIRLGVPGTGMASFSGLSDEEIWNLSFYLKTLGYENVKAPTEDVAKKFSLKEIASLSDEDLKGKLLDIPEQDQGAVIASIRTFPPSEDNGNPLQMAEDLLKESYKHAKNNNFDDAKSLALRAYLEGIEPVEPKMKANVPGLTEEIENLMSGYRSLISQKASIEKITESYERIQSSLAKAKDLLAHKKMSPGVAFVAAFSIFLREGFEAVLIIIVLISILKAMGQTEAIRWVHGGWLAATVVGLGAWFASGYVVSLSGLSREILEGGISVLAVLVLFYVGFWLHRYSEAKKWRLFLEAKLKTGLESGSYFVLAVVAFLAVFREAFEVILFLRAIWLDLDNSGQNIASLGVVSSFVILMGLSYFAVLESKKLPIGKLFEICSWTMMALAFILAGKGLHSLQEAGVLSITNLPIDLRWDLIGLFPTLETISAQVIIAISFAALLYRDKKENLKAS